MKNHQLVLIPALLAASFAMAADPAKIDWGQIAPKNVPLFYPGQSSYEWVRSEAHKGAVTRVTRGEACTFCHDETDAEKVRNGRSTVTRSSTRWFRKASSRAFMKIA
jgi:hypothetical protein